MCQDVCAYGHAHRTEFFYKDRAYEPRCEGFAQTLDMLRRLVNGLWKYEQKTGDQFQWEYHHKIDDHINLIVAGGMAYLDKHRKGMGCAERLSEAN